jgi:hypothetical protein
MFGCPILRLFSVFSGEGWDSNTLLQAAFPFPPFCRKLPLTGAYFLYASPHPPQPVPVGTGLSVPFPGRKQPLPPPPSPSIAQIMVHTKNNYPIINSLQARTSNHSVNKPAKNRVLCSILQPFLTLNALFPGGSSHFAQHRFREEAKCPDPAFMTRETTKAEESGIPAKSPPSRLQSGSFQSSTGFTDPRGMKLCPIHRTSLFLSDGWESVELHDDIAFC